jgi:type VI secretion system protein ImpA
LRVLTYGALAELNLNGLVAFSEAMDALNTCMANFWDDVHPRLDEDDNNDATMRFNTLQMMNDHELVFESLMRAPLVTMKGVGSFSLRDIELAEGRIKPVGEEEVHDIALIRGAFSEASAEDMVALGEGVSTSIEHLKRMVELWDELAPAEPSIDIDEALKAMKDVMEAISNYAPAAAAAIAGDEEEGDEQVMGGAPQAQQSLSGTINNRNDVSRAIDKICDYFSQHEPSSPIPLLLRRSQRFLSMDFMEILKDMAPSGVEEASVISGIPQEEEY